MRMHLALLAAIMLFGCPPSTKEQQAGLEAAYREAHGAKDLQRLENLVVWGEAQELEREVFRGVARFDFDLPIGRIEFKPLEANQPLTYERGGVTPPRCYRLRAGWRSPSRYRRGSLTASPPPRRATLSLRARTDTASSRLLHSGGPAEAVRLGRRTPGSRTAAPRAARTGAGFARCSSDQKRGLFHGGQ